MKINRASGAHFGQKRKPEPGFGFASPPAHLFQTRRVQVRPPTRTRPMSYGLDTFSNPNTESLPPGLHFQPAASELSRPTLRPLELAESLL